MVSQLLHRCVCELAKHAIWRTLFGAGFGAGLAAYFGIRQVRFQRRIAEKDRRDQLLTALDSEIRASQRILSGRPTPIEHWVTRKEVGRIVLVPLPHVVVEEAARSALFSSEETDGFFNLSGKIQVHNNEITFFYATRTGLVTEVALQIATDELKERQDELRQIFKELLSD